MRCKTRSRFLFSSVLLELLLNALFRDLVSPEKPKDKTLDTLFKVLENHYSPAPLVIAERYNFNKCLQTSSESVSEYISVLRKLATHCKFEAFLNDALRD